MKKFLFTLFLAASLLQIQNINAQCNFKPGITPSTLIFCPAATDTLSTEKYDTYQWLRNNKPIAGATHRKLILQQEQDEGYYYSVIATKNGCADTSKRVLADGYAFNPPILIEQGDIGVFNPYLDALVECPDDTLILTLGVTYTENVQWYNLQKPINGANQQSYNVTRNGSYTVCGAPSVCPNYIQCENLPLNAVFEDPKVTITRFNDTLFASDKKEIYQWYKNGRMISGANQQFYIPDAKGIYTVVAYDKYKCKAVSKPFFFTPDNKNNLITVSPNPVNNIMHIHINSAQAKEIVVSDLFGILILSQKLNSADENISMQNIHAGNYLLQVLNNNQSVIGSVMIIKQ